MIFCYKKGRTWLFSWHFYGCCTLFLFGFWWEGKKRVLKGFVKNFFLCAARVFLLCSFLKRGMVLYVAGSQTGLFGGGLATKFAFNLSILNFGIKVWKSAQMQCLQELVDSRRHMLQSLFIWICTCPTLQKND